MRFLECSDGGKFSLKELQPHDAPHYAILSHTWGPNSEEVTYQDMVNGTGEAKTGYQKLKFCAEQAKRDGLRYFWVDTCCIDKLNNTELSSAINSMFRWYQKAAQCYVYLADVSLPASTAQSTNPQDPSSYSLWEPAFRSSRWFTRGWTLQELVAPASVKFFTKEGKMLGDKRSLEQQIHEITRIPIPALGGGALSDFEVDERFRWAERRQTTKEEDLAYCLLGIFDVFLPLIYGEGKEHALRRLKKEIVDARNRHDAANGRQAKDHIWMVPFQQNPSFASRESELGRLRQALFTGHGTAKVAITGLGGVGKTQIALELAFRIRAEKRGCSVIWIPATSKESLEQAYRSAAAKLSVPGCTDDKADVMKLVQDHLSTEEAGRWLLVIDNADDIDMWVGTPGPGSRRLIEYLPHSSGGTIIFTTRDKKAATKLAGPNVVEIPEMDEMAGKQLLHNYLIDKDLSNHEDASSLLSRLTYLPLAIVQAAMYINENSLSLGDYLSLLEEQEEDVIDLLSEDFQDERRYQDIKNPVATTWLISFEQIRRRDPLAADYLSFMACVDSKDIPQSLLPPGPSRKKKMDAMGTLKAYSFITKRDAGSGVNIHRLVHMATRNWLRKEDLLSPCMDKAIRRLVQAFKDANAGNRVVWRPYLPHAYYTLNSELANRDDTYRLKLLRAYGRCLRYDGRYWEAAVVFKQEMETRQRVLGEEHPDTLLSIGNLASTYWDQGRWGEAEPLEVQVLGTSKRVLGEEHPDTLLSMGNLASTYRGQGRLGEAEPLEVQVLETSKRVLGEEHPDTLLSMGNLASTYRDQGRWGEAEPLEVRVLETSKRVLGEEHLDTLLSMGNLASTYRGQGRWGEAEPLEVRVLETSKRVLGEEHPDTLLSMGNLASIYWNQGRLGEAEPLEVRVLETRKRVLGEEHPDTLLSMGNLASIYWDQGRLGEAEPLEVRVLETRKRVLGEEHPDTSLSKANLAYTWRSQGRHEDASVLMESCVQARRRILGPEHPKTLVSLEILNRWKSEDMTHQEVELD